MARRTLVFLVLLVLGLGALWLTKERETLMGGPTLDQVRLLPGLDGSQVRAVRIDNLERAVQVKLERDVAGRWFLTEPVAYPAQDALVRALFSALVTAVGDPVGDTPIDQLGLDPPLAVIECLLVGEDSVGAANANGDEDADDAHDGRGRSLRIEVGGLDLDPDRIFVRVPGHPAAGRLGPVFRTYRTLYTVLDRNPDDYRERRATPLRGAEVTGLRRSGSVWLAEEGRQVDLAFDALAGPDGWKRVAPVVTLDPTAMGLLARGSADLTVDRFVDDSPVDLARYGLVDPAVTFELQGLSGPPVVLHFGFAPHEGRRPIEEEIWYAQRAGYDHVWSLGGHEIGLLVRPAELFYDQRAVRFARSEVQRVELARAGVTCVLERVQAARASDADPVRAATWTVREGDLEADAAGFPADAEAVEELLLAFDRLNLGDHLPEGAFEPSDPALSFTLQFTNGARVGGDIGAAAQDGGSGARGFQYLRHGDEVPALIGEEAADVCRWRVDRFRSPRVLRVPEALVRVIELEEGGRTFAYVNTGDNVWNVRGQLIRAPRALVESLDGLLNLNARSWLERPAPPTRELLVRLERLNDEPLAFSLGRLSDGRAVCTSPSGGVAEVDPALLERLLGLFD